MKPGYPETQTLDVVAKFGRKRPRPNIANTSLVREREDVSPPASWRSHAAKGPLRLISAMVLLTLCSCGYHVSGTTNLMPKTVKTIAIPAFSNITTTYKVTDMLSEAVTREFISRTKYHITADPATADATLQGAVTQISTFPTVYDPITFRAANVEVHVSVRVKLVDKTGKVLFDRPGMEVRERYEVSIDPTVYFDESEFAMRRMSKDVAKSIVSAILENF
jgi:hypothetical protein